MLVYEPVEHTNYGLIDFSDFSAHSRGQDHPTAASCVSICPGFRCIRPYVSAIDRLRIYPFCSKITFSTRASYLTGLSVPSQSFKASGLAPYSERIADLKTFPARIASSVSPLCLFSAFLYSGIAWQSLIKPAVSINRHLICCPISLGKAKIISTNL